MTGIAVLLAVGFVAEVAAFWELCRFDRAIHRERLLLASKWEELVKQAEEVNEVANEVSIEVQRHRAMAIGYAEIYGDGPIKLN